VLRLYERTPKKPSADNSGSRGYFGYEVDSNQTSRNWWPRPLPTVFLYTLCTRSKMRAPAKAELKKTEVYFLMVSKPVLTINIDIA
jgi:hypothetical protein